jgi:hypothetical protein
MQMDAEEYFLEITSPDPVSFEGLSDVDLKGINDGVVALGMSKKGETIAYGIPPRHKTPSFKDNAWFYWKNRFDIMAIGFDKNGIVREIKD